MVAFHVQIEEVLAGKPNKYSKPVAWILEQVGFDSVGSLEGNDGIEANWELEKLSEKLKTEIGFQDGLTAPMQAYMRCLLKETRDQDKRGAGGNVKEYPGKGVDASPLQLLLEDVEKKKKADVVTVAFAEEMVKLTLKGLPQGLWPAAEATDGVATMW